MIAITNMFNIYCSVIDISLPQILIVDHTCDCLLFAFPGLHSEYTIKDILPAGAPTDT